MCHCVFKGIIAPKVELSARIGVQDHPQHTKENENFVQQSGNNISLKKLEFEAKNTSNRHTQLSLTPTNSCFNYLEEKRRQRPVCHVKTNCGNGCVFSLCSFIFILTCIKLRFAQKIFKEKLCFSLL